MKKHGRKSLGQHFLTNKKTLQRILKVISAGPGDLILEIGAGKGALTFPLTKSGAEIIALEKDKTLIAYLERQEYANLTVLEGDVLEVKFGDIFQGRTGKIVGNLPYAISSPLLFKILEEREFISSCIFLFQKEVAQRVCASPGIKKYAPLSILIQNDFIARLHFRVPPSFFSPPPRVESALVSLKKRREPLSTVAHLEGFSIFLKNAFRTRRKKLANNLKAIGISAGRINEAYAECGIDENWRAEQVSLAQFVLLYRLLFEDP